MRELRLRSHFVGMSETAMTAPNEFDMKSLIVQVREMPGMVACMISSMAPNNAHDKKMFTRVEIKMSRLASARTAVKATTK